MTSQWIHATMIATLLTGVSVPTMAAPTMTDLETQIQTMQAEIDTLRAQQESSDWTDQRRTDELKALVAAALADADTRAALMADSATAGIDDKGKIFLQSADGAFKMNIGGQFQMRYIYNQQDGVAGGANDVESGFQMRRVKLNFKGHIADPKIYYKLVLATERNSGPGGGNVVMEDAYAGYKFDNGMYVQAGVFKLPFARQELVSSSKQVAVDRGQVTEFYTLNRSDQVQFGWKDDTLATAVSISDGANNDFTDFTNTQSRDFAVTGRVDWKIAGDWKQAKDEIAWSGEEFAAFLGGAFHYEASDATGVQNPSDWYAWTVDALVEVARFGASAALFGASDQNDTAPETNPLGFYLQGVYTVDDTWAPYVRYEYNDSDQAGVDTTQNVTVGVNYFLKKHAAKFTGDVVYIFDGSSANSFSGALNQGDYSSGLGLQGKPNGADQLALRLQFQLLF